MSERCSNSYTVGGGGLAILHVNVTRSCSREEAPLGFRKNSLENPTHSKTCSNLFSLMPTPTVHRQTATLHVRSKLTNPFPYLREKNMSAGPRVPLLDEGIYFNCTHHKWSLLTKGVLEHPQRSWMSKEKAELQHQFSGTHGSQRWFSVWMMTGWWSGSFLDSQEGDPGDHPQMGMLLANKTLSKAWPCTNFRWSPKETKGNCGFSSRRVKPQLLQRIFPQNHPLYLYQIYNFQGIPALKNWWAGLPTALLLSIFCPPGPLKATEEVRYTWPDFLRRLPYGRPQLCLWNRRCRSLCKFLCRHSLLGRRKKWPTHLWWPQVSAGILEIVR